MNKKTKIYLYIIGFITPILIIGSIFTGIYIERSNQKPCKCSPIARFNKYPKRNDIFIYYYKRNDSLFFFKVNDTSIYNKLGIKHHE